MGKKNTAPKPQDNTIYKAMAAMGFLCVGILLLQVLKNNYTSLEDIVANRPIFRWVAIGGLAAAVAGLIMVFLKKPAVRMTGIGVLAAGIVVAVACGSLYVYLTVAISYLYFFVIASSALYLIWLLYPHDFCLLATLATLSGGAFYLHGQRSYTSSITVLLYLILAVLILATVVICQKAAKNDGVLTCKGQTLRLFSGKAGTMPLYLTCAILLACIVAALILGSTFAFYCVYAAVGGLFVAACYYTIRLN